MEVAGTVDGHDGSEAVRVGHDCQVVCSSFTLASTWAIELVGSIAVSVETHTSFGGRPGK